MWYQSITLTPILIIYSVLVLGIVGTNIPRENVDVRLDDLQAQVMELKAEISEINRMVSGNNDLETLVKLNIADQKMDKAVANLLMNKQSDADIYWKEITDLVANTSHKSYLKRIIENSYLGDRDNFYFVLDFVTRNDLQALAYPMLYKELEMHKELRTGQEIFALAHEIRSLCGSKNNFFMTMPQVIKEILGGPVILQNLENKGYVIADENYKLCSTRRECYEYTDTQVHLYRSEFTSMEELERNPRAHWHFVGPENNITALSNGFFIKNMDQDLFFVFRQRPASVLLRNNLTFDSYYAREFHAQFEPSLNPSDQNDDLVLLIGVREKFFRKIEYFKSAEFVKRQNRADFSRLPIFRGEVTGYVWKVIPVNGSEAIDNTIDGNNDPRCDFVV